MSKRSKRKLYLFNNEELPTKYVLRKIKHSQENEERSMVCARDPLALRQLSLCGSILGKESGGGVARTHKCDHPIQFHPCCIHIQFTISHQRRHRSLQEKECGGISTVQDVLVPRGTQPSNENNISEYKLQFDDPTEANESFGTLINAISMPDDENNS